MPQLRIIINLFSIEPLQPKWMSLDEHQNACKPYFKPQIFWVIEIIKFVDTR